MLDAGLTALPIAAALHSAATASPPSLTPNAIPAALAQGIGTYAQAYLSLLDISTPSGPTIQTRYDKIPDFGAHPTIVSVQSGNWSDPNTWGGALPTDGDVVQIAPGTTVTYDLNSDTALNTVSIEAGATLQFRTDIDTKLIVANLLVKPNGTLTVGTADNPVAANVHATIMFPDVPLDTVNDPEQYGHGLIGLGNVTMYGSARSQGFINLASAAHAGDTALTLATPASGWQVGDTLYLPDTHQLNWFEQWPSPDGYKPQYETVTVAGISADGKTLYLSSALKFDHLGSANSGGPSEFLPDVANLTRNVVVRSENARGTRGYTLFEDRANVDIHSVAFLGLGRTTNDEFDDTTFNDDGTVAHLGTNEEGRYPVSFRHLIGPTSPQDDGYQYTFADNVVMCPLDPMPFRWGVDIADSDYGLIQDNVLDNWAGAGLVTEYGNEVGNVINHNFVTRINGDGQRAVDKPQLGGNGEIAQEGAGFWFRGPDNIVTNNVATDIRGGGSPYAYGFVVYADGVGAMQVPAHQGDDPLLAGQSVTVNMNATPLLNFSGNEVYGATYNGMSLWHLGTNGNQAIDDASAGVVKDFTVWNVSGYGYYGYESQNLTLDGFVARGDTNLDPANWAPFGIWFSDYFQKGLVITNADIRGFQVGIVTPDYSDGKTVIENSYLNNLTNILVNTMGSVNGSAGLPAKETDIINVRFGTKGTAIAMNYSTQEFGSGSGANLVQSDQVFVYNYNGVAGNNFQVYYYQQDANFIVPQTGLSSDGIDDLIGAPEAGLTNQQCWDQYGIAIGGAVAPSTATDGSNIGISGLIVPLAGDGGGSAGMTVDDRA